METPDFDVLARRLYDAVVESEDEAVADAVAAETVDFNAIGNRLDASVIAIVEILRTVWNARGTVDVATIEAELARMMGGTASGPYVINLEGAIKRSDR